MGTIVAIVLLVLIVGLAIFTVVRSVRIVPQAQAGIVERFGRYHRTLHAGLNLVTPFIDRLRPLIDLREQVVSFPPQPVITKDNLVVGIDTVIYFQVTDPKSATYEIANYVAAVEQLTVTTLRNVVGGMDLDTTLTSRDFINGELRKELDEATGRWGLRVSRVELKAIEPPASIQGSMEKQMRADRDKRAAILSAEGAKQSAILTAEGEKQAAVLRARGEAEAEVVRAEADATAAGRPGARPGAGDRDGLPRDPRGQPRSAAAGLQVPGDAPGARAGQRQQDVDRAERARQGARGPRRLLRQRDRRDGGQAARRRRPGGAAGPGGQQRQRYPAADLNGRGSRGGFAALAAPLACSGRT